MASHDRAPSLVFLHPLFSWMALVPLQWITIQHHLLNKCWRLCENNWLHNQGGTADTTRYNNSLSKWKPNFGNSCCIPTFYKPLSNGPWVFCGLSKSLQGTPQLVVWVNAEYSLNKILFSRPSCMGCYILINPVLANEINIQWLRRIHQQKTFHCREVPCMKCLFDSSVKHFSSNWHF